ncbi:MAG: transcription antitermination factor NusB [Pseudomonadota bacterium]|nr:transcription antitermination factor NusB [Pseudomonadota bacterium]
MEHSKSSDARSCAANLVHDVLHRRRPFDEALSDRPDLNALEPRDRAFARLIAATVLRRLGQIDAVIAHCLDRPLPDKAARGNDILRTGMAQILFMDTPPHAAVDRTVAQFAGRSLTPFRKLANAVMRRAAREGAVLIAEQDSARLNTPDWLWRSWREAFGEETCRRIAESHAGEPMLDITVKDDAAVWAGKLAADILPTGTLRRETGGLVRDLAGFADGAWWVQDAAAALPAKLLIGALGDNSGAMNIADLCAAPGGKTAQLAAAGMNVTAVDRSPARMKRLAENLDRLGLHAEMIETPVEDWRPPDPFDAILLDAPCTATGTIRRHPDIAWLKSADDVGRMANIQSRLLAAAGELVKPGGILVYSVCSMQPDEGPARIKAFLDDGAPFERIAVAPDEIGGLAHAVTTEGDLLTLPCHFSDKGGIDGFFAARLRRSVA